MKGSVKMRFSQVATVQAVLLLLLAKSYSAFAQRERNKHSLSPNFDTIDHRFHHDIHDDPEDHFGDLSHSSAHHDADSHHPQGACEPISIGSCIGIGYNQTSMPNTLGHDSQRDAEIQLQTFNPLIQYGCHSSLKLFLCSAHVPMCTDKVPQPIGPCRSLCESVKRHCEPVMKEFGFSWPKTLDCSKFHAENNHENLCNPGPTESHYRAPASSSVTPRREQTHTSFDRLPAATIFGDGSKKDSPAGKKGGARKGKEDEGKCMGIRKIWNKGECYLKCSAASLDASEDEQGSLFHPSEKSFARNYALLWAVLSLSAAVIALTLSVCSPRFSVAERPILYLALCQVLYSIGVIIGSTSSVSCFVEKTTGSNLLARGGMVPSSCAFVFLLTYFFGMATTMWWVILSLSWLLSLNRGVASSLLQKESSLFHLIVWGTASLLTSTALVHKKVDTDELTGICGVGYQDLEALTLYNLIPLSLSLSIGLLLLISGLTIRIFFPDWNLPLCKFRCFKRKSKAEGQRIAGCELSNNSAATTTASHQTGQTHPNSFRSQQSQGYSPVLVQPPMHHPYHPGYPVPPCPMDQGHCGGHMGYANTASPHNSNCNCSTILPGQGQGGLLYSTGNSPASVVGIGGFQRLRALENTKAIWMRIGIFALVHSLPIACQVGTIVYEMWGREGWENRRERPNLQIFLLRLNMNLIAGLTTGVWVLSTYSWKSLLTFSQKLCLCLQFPGSKKKAKAKAHLEQKMPHPVPNSVVAPLLTSNVGSYPIPVPSGSSSSSNNHTSTMPILGSNNTFTARGALAPHNIPSANNNFPRAHYNHPVPPVPPRNPDHIAIAQQMQQHRTDVWRRGETIV